MIILPTLKQLRHLSLLAEQRHFGKAAKAANVTQSTLSASIKELEDVLQATLIDRSKRAVILTAVGEETVRRAHTILKEAEELALAAQAKNEPLSGALRLGVIPTIGPYLLPRVLAKLRRRYPQLKLYLREDMTERLVSQLESGELDLVLLALPYQLNSMETTILFEDAFSFCCRADHKLAQHQVITPARLKDENLLLLQDGHCLRPHALEACHLKNKPTTDPFEATSLPTLVQMVANGLGVTLLPQLALDAGLTKGTSLTVIPLGKEAPSRQIGLAWRRHTARQSEYALFGHELKDLQKQLATA